MDQEEFDRIKAQEKEHLKALQKLKAAKKVADRQLRVKNALDQIQDRSVFDTHDEMLDKLQRDNIETEAKLEMAMDSASIANDQADELAKSEEELQKIRATLLVEKMKAEMFGVLSSKPTTNVESGENDSPAKTIGRPNLEAQDRSTSENATAENVRSEVRPVSELDDTTENTSSEPSKTIGRPASTENTSDTTSGTEKDASPSPSTKTIGRKRP